MSQYQKGKSNLDFTEARDSEWQWHQLGHMQVCISLQTDNHASSPPLSFLQARCPSCCPTNSVRALKAITNQTEDHWKTLTWNRSEHVGHEDADDGLVEHVVSLSHVLLDGSHAAQRVKLVCWKLLFGIAVTHHRRSHHDGCYTIQQNYRSH